MCKHQKISRSPLKKPLLVFLHGFLGDPSDWDFYAGQLSNQYNVQCISLPGHNHQPMQTFDMFIQSLPSPAHFIGYSMGGRIILELAKRFPSSVLSASIISSHPGLRTKQEKEEKLQSESQWQKVLLTNSMSAFVQLWYQAPMFQNFFPPKMRSKQDSSKMAAILKEFSIVKTPSFWNDISKFASQILWIFGEWDEKYRSIGEEIQKLSPKAQVKIIKNASHPAHLQQKETCLQLIKKHMETFYAND